ncbi:MAG TPA: hypothetical protein HPP77_01330 [Candidatus Hydrogenedentes bacterium]|nr:hypothetical protein [Candidatus Hydrogenedentota bacterium]HIJ73201.1 hypothetical protein [Candidatus Hydrogenedentota bacterium]
MHIAAFIALNLTAADGLWSDAVPGPGDLPMVTELPDVLAGRTYAPGEEWEARRRDMLRPALDYEYGHPPEAVEVTATDTTTEPVFDGLGTLHRATLHLGDAVSTPFAVYLPAGEGPHPILFVITPVWIDELRGAAEAMLRRGYGWAGFGHEEIAPDRHDRTIGLHAAYPEDEFGTLAAWAWGFSRCADYLLTLPGVDPNRIAITGHSRGGKTALLAGALDTRFALVIPHCSGTGGAAASRFRGFKAESVALITDPKRFDYWFHPRFAAFGHKEFLLPFDQHFLMAAVAPRALLVQEARDDFWANPTASQATWRAALPAFRMLDVEEHTAWTIRDGEHSMPLEDYLGMLDFADRLWGAPSPRATD